MISFLDPYHCMRGKNAISKLGILSNQSESDKSI
jgi:hypothetical protein